MTKALEKRSSKDREARKWRVKLLYAGRPYKPGELRRHWECLAGGGACQLRGWDIMETSQETEPIAHLLGN